MGWLSKLGGALVDCVSKPIDALWWATEPLESRRHDQLKALEHHRINMKLSCRNQNKG